MKELVNRYLAECIGSFTEFLEKSLADLKVFTEKMILTPSKLIIPFCSTRSIKKLKVLNYLPSFLMDFTFKTNYHGLLLGVAGPAGMWQDEKTSESHMRFFHVYSC